MTSFRAMRTVDEDIADLAQEQSLELELVRHELSLYREAYGHRFEKEMGRKRLALALSTCGVKPGVSEQVQEVFQRLQEGSES